MLPPTSDPFEGILVLPSELQSALSKDAPSSRRVVPVAAGRESGLKSYADQHIPGSVFFNLDEVRDKTSPYPLMLPQPSEFAAYMTKLGICGDDILVFYDTLEAGLYFSPRAAWVCRHFGHKDVYVLNNFPCYVNQGYEVVSGSQSMTLTSGQLYPKRNPSALADVIDFQDLQSLLLSHNSEEQEFQILDSRPAGQFSGADQQSGISGHMPSSLNVPLSSILGPDKTIIPPAQLEKLFQDKGVQKSLPIILSCNTGTTAAALELALRVSGYDMEKAIYDGSWMEWRDKVKITELIVIDC